VGVFGASGKLLQVCSPTSTTPVSTGNLLKM
jgi:hypothetical protein